MRVLILSANTGGGHNSTAEALAEQFRKWNIDYEIMDALTMISEKVSHFVSWGHSYVYRHFPSLFGSVYRFEERHPPKFIYEQCAKGAERLQAKLLSEHFDAVICVHIFSSMMISEVRVRYNNHIPHYFIATDYTCSPGVTELNADKYFIPHRMLFGEFVRGTVPADKMFATGIPVREDFYRNDDPSDIRRELGIDEGNKLILMSCGSIGCGNLDRQARSFVKKLPKDTTLVVLCGKNEKLYQSLEPYQSSRLKVLGFNNLIPRLMSAADIYLTKPGGLMTTEAIAKRLPMVLVDAVPGCETRNFDFLTQNGVAFGGKSWHAAMHMAISLLQHPEKLEEQRQAMEQFLPPASAEHICKMILKDEL